MLAKQAQQPAHLAVHKLGKVFPTRRGPFTALHDVTMHVETNELVCIVGASGSGKSTLLRIIAGLIPAGSGEVLIDGRLVSGPGSDRGMIFQHDTLFPWLSVAENVAYGLKLQGMPKAARRELSMHYLQIVGLERCATSLPHQLSGGMKQRAAIARALATEPALLLMDEPFGALDAQTRLLMQEFLLRIWRETQTTILLVTHDVSEAVFLGQRIYFFASNPGRVETEIEVPLPGERDFSIKQTPQFHALEAQLLTLLRQESLKHELEVL